MLGRFRRSAQELAGHDLNAAWVRQYPRVPLQLDSMDALRQWIDGYDMGIWYADLWVGKLLESLKAKGIFEDTVIIVSSDHAESQGEFNVWGDHQTADPSVCRVPLLIRWPLSPTKFCLRWITIQRHQPGAWTMRCTTLTGQRRSSEMAGGTVPANWDEVSYARH